jgi:methylated-DNA-protein-cysteine methyltransferase-like protein
MDMELAGRMLDEVAAVPAGWVATYGDIAARAGSRSPRLAGRVLAELGDATTPWHRIVRADGTTAAHLEIEQCALLGAEGVQMVGGKIDLRRYRHRPPRVDSVPQLTTEC